MLFVAAACGTLAAAEVTLHTAIQSGVIAFEGTGNARDNATAKLTNRTDSAIVLGIPAGTVFVSAKGARQVTLRSLTATIAAKDEATAIFPTAAMASSNGGSESALTPAPPIAQLGALLAQFDKQPDLPRATAQLAVFVILEDIKWPDWVRWLPANPQPGKQPPTPTQVAQAVDALAFVKLAVPELKPAVLADENFKRLALRNPWARGKAMVLYGITVDDAITGDPSLPPDLGKLLHTSPNDNCAICRQRGKQPEFP